VVRAGLVCGACAAGQGPAPAGGAQTPAAGVLPTASVGRPSVLARNLAVPWAIAFLPGGDALVTGIPRAAIHNGGRLAFGPDGMLWAATGEHGEPGLAQDRDSLGGKILRMTPDGRPAPGNPFGTLVWTLGHRNVEGLAWDGAGRMYATEFGQDRFDEVNRIERGRNYGWPAVEGAGGAGRYADPLVTWPTDQASPSGAAIAGSLWVAALRGERLWQIPLGRAGGAGTPVAHFVGDYGRLRAVVRAPDGSLWCTTSNRDGRGNTRQDDDKILVIPLR
jgi:glucose/arabinose dehydrogenase